EGGGAGPAGRGPAGGGGGERMRSRIIALEPPRKLTIAWEGTGDVTFALEAQGTEVLLTVTHRRLPDRPTLLGVSAGWHIHLDVLVARPTGTAPVPYWD